MTDTAAKVSERRLLNVVSLSVDLAIAGGGFSGICAAISAARAGIKVAVVQDRPVLGGNASSEVRLWILGATSHMGNNNRWAREGGVVDEILVENLWRNPEGNSVILDSLLLEKVATEENITLLLNTAIDSVDLDDRGRIRSAGGFCSQNRLRYVITAPLFCDASGDGILGFLSGAAFRMGAEGRGAFGELLAPPSPKRELLGHSLYFYSRDTGRPVSYIAPSFAIRDISQIPRIRDLKISDNGCRLWWLEYGGRLDTVHQTEEIKWELWKLAYGVWNHIKNSGLFPEAETLTLDWMGMIPGKRESRRFEGDYMLNQRDVIEQIKHADAVSFGGWAIDLHPVDGVYSQESSCTQWHSKGVYSIPYRTMYSRNVPNLFLTGRLISASHIAFGSTRVMATCGHNAQVVGIAAALCTRHNIEPRQLLDASYLIDLQTELLRTGQYIPHLRLSDPYDLVPKAKIRASSTFHLGSLLPDGTTASLNVARAMLLPIQGGPVPSFELMLDAIAETMVTVELRGASKLGNYTPDVLLASKSLPVKKGLKQAIRVDFDLELTGATYAFLTLRANPVLSIHLSGQRITGVLSVSRSVNSAVAKDNVQSPPEKSGVDSFEFWLPARRPNGKNWAIQITPMLDSFEAQNISNGFSRPFVGTNAWVAALEDAHPTLWLEWAAPQTIKRVELCFDTDFDHPMESVLMSHPERAMPFCIENYRLLDAHDDVLYEVNGNHNTRKVCILAKPVITDVLKIEVLRKREAPAAIFEIRCYS